MVEVKGKRWRRSFHGRDSDGSGVRVRTLTLYVRGGIKKKVVIGLVLHRPGILKRNKDWKKLTGVLQGHHHAHQAQSSLLLNIQKAHIMNQLAFHFPTLGIGIGHQPIVTAPYPIWLTATQLGAICLVLLLSAIVAVYNVIAVWKRWRGGHVKLGEDCTENRLPPKNMKEAQDREIWDNVRNMMPEKDEPIGLERFWLKVSYRPPGSLSTELADGIGAIAISWTLPHHPPLLLAYWRQHRAPLRRLPSMDNEATHDRIHLLIHHSGVFGLVMPPESR